MLRWVRAFMRALARMLERLGVPRAVRNDAAHDRSTEAVPLDRQAAAEHLCTIAHGAQPEPGRRWPAGRKAPTIVMN